MHIKNNFRGTLTMMQRLEVAQAIVAVAASPVGQSNEVADIREWRLQTSRIAVALHEAGGFNDMRNVAEALFALDESVHGVVCVAWRGIKGYELWQSEGLPA